MITKQEKEKVWELYKKKTSISEIARTMKMSRPTVYHILDEEEIKEEKENKKKENIITKTAEIFQLFRDGKTNNEILAIVGVEPERVIKLREAFDINLKQERQIEEQKEKLFNKLLWNFKVENDMLTQKEREHIKQQNHKEKLMNMLWAQGLYDEARKISLTPAKTVYSDFLKFKREYLSNS